MSKTSENNGGTGGTSDVDCAPSRKRSHSAVSDCDVVGKRRDFTAEKIRRKELAEMSLDSKATYTATKGKKRKQEFRTQYEDERKIKKIITVETDIREETHEVFKEGLYLSRSRIIDKDGGN